MKYILTETKEVQGHPLRRIECAAAFADVNVGDKGGWVESESNLSQEGNAWVYENDRVCGDECRYGTYHGRYRVLFKKRGKKINDQ